MPASARQSAVLIFSLLLLFSPSVFAADTATQKTLTSPSGEDFSFDVYSPTKQKPNFRILWIAPGFGIDQRLRETAEALAKQSVEVWVIDLADALFLPKGAQTMREIPGKIVADFINMIALQGGTSEVLVISGRYGAIPALRGIHAWQSQAARQGKLIGTLFFSPSFFTQVPELGSTPTFIDELVATNVPIYIFQAARNGNRWHLPAVLAELKHATVFSEIIKDAMSVFYKKDTSVGSAAAFKKAPQMILRAARLLRQYPVPNTALPIGTKSKIARSGINDQLRKYRGSVQAMPITLRDINGRQYNIQDFKGKVTLVNFWASWCRPCVKEIPSLNRLKNAMQGKPFQLISINYAETAEDIRRFMSMANVDFPVLVDPDGRLAGQWKVVAFPSTFVIGPDGKIHYGVNAGIQWDTEAVSRQLNQLLPKSSSANAE